MKKFFCIFCLFTILLLGACSGGSRKLNDRDPFIFQGKWKAMNGGMISLIAMISIEQFIFDRNNNVEIKTTEDTFTMEGTYSYDGSEIVFDIIVVDVDGATPFTLKYDYYFKNPKILVLIEDNIEYSYYRK